MSTGCITLNIAIADDHPVIIDGLLKNLGEDIKIVGRASAASEIVGLVSRSNPDVLVMESRLGAKDALRNLEEFGAVGSCPPVVVFSGFSEPSNIARASALGCHDYILKSAPVQQLLDALHRAAQGQPTPEASLLNTVRSRMRSNASGPHSALTNREMQVLRHVAMGLSNREVGKSLGISVETVKEHVQNILRKLHVNDRTQAAVWAVRNELV